MSLPRLLAFTLVSVFCASTVQAQFEIVGGVRNSLHPNRAGAYATVSGTGEVALTLRGGGSGYSSASPPNVVISAPNDASGIPADFTAIVTAGEVTGFTLIHGGTGYSDSNRPSVFIDPPAVPSGAPATTPQFAGMANTSGTAGPMDGRQGVLTSSNANMGSAIGDTDDAEGGLFPRSLVDPLASPKVVAINLGRASLGHSFASGAPLYLMGDEIQRPLKRADGSELAGSTSLEKQAYWRAKPVEPGELFSAVPVGVSQPVLQKFDVDVTKSATDSTDVTVSSVPPTLTQGATLLGQRVDFISGTSINLAGDADETITASKNVKFSPFTPYYYSPHAGRVFAIQPGRVSITWVSRLPDITTGETEPTFKFREEIFAVSSASRTASKTIYWTHTQYFDGPIVIIPHGRIKAVRPAYNRFVPGRTTPYKLPDGSTDNEQRTLWFDKDASPATLNAYNVTGRVFVEYLGEPQAGGSGASEFLGADVVDIRRAPDVQIIETKLGERLLPRSGTPEPGDERLVTDLRVLGNTTNLTGIYQRPDGVTEYYAEKQNLTPENVGLYWLDPGDAAIHFLASPSLPGLSIQWPKYKCHYRQVWPSSLADYEPVNVTSSGSTEANGPRFAAASLPTIVYQDDSTDPLEARIDGETQRLIVDLSASVDKTNRSLLKFGQGSAPWYVRLYIQSQDLLGTPANPDTETPAVFTLNDRNADGIRDYSASSPLSPPPGTVGARVSATVGTRIGRPDASYALAGHVARGRCYSVLDYQDPFALGVEAAGSGGIIPVNALSSDRSLTIWWFKKVSPPNASVTPFYVPAVAATYEVSYPSSPQELVIASGKGVADPGLTSAQASGSIYVQNDSESTGYNPNEEHALMLAGNAYALRTDLNTATSSEPFVLIRYKEAGSGRPLMRTLRVLKENVTYPLSYDKIAGTPLQPPLPLAALPLPLRFDETVRNTEVSGLDDTLNPSAPPLYNRFTFEDRKGRHWLYRGPHAGGTPSFEMEFYYYLQEGFYFPSRSLDSQPAVGSIQPFIKDEGTGVATPLTYFPKWPDDPSLDPADRKELGVLHAGQTLTLPKAGLPQVRGQSSAQLLYQQSLAREEVVHGGYWEIVALHDPTRKKTFALGGADQLAEIPSSVATSSYAGNTYFQKLPPHLQNRFYFNPNEGARGSLVLIGEFVDVSVGEDYLNLNQLSMADIDELKGLCPGADTTNKPKWDAAIMALSTTLQTFRKHSPATASADFAEGTFYLTLDDGGWGYTEAPLVTILPGDAPGSRAATATATVTNGVVSALVITNPGSGYDNDDPILVSIAPPIPGYSIDSSKDEVVALGQRANVSSPDTAVDSYALSATGTGGAYGSGYVTLLFGNGGAFTDQGDPVNMQIIKVDPEPYSGDVKVILASNPLDEQVTLRHSGDYGGKTENFDFEWRYGFPVSGTPPTGDPADSGNWIDPKPGDSLGSSVLVGGSPTAVINTPAVLMANTYFTMRYRQKGRFLESEYSDWTTPVLVEGWISRVLAKITPFNQRMDNLFNTSVNTDVSLLTQAGQRWEGDIALNLENVNDAGLIEIYETVLNRGKDFTIRSGIDFGPSNNSLLLAAGYLSDLYTILGNEAFADAANPTISIDDQDTVTEVNTSRFSFEGQVASSLDEELALLRGRDDFGLPSVELAPAYNRLFWNYTRGIDSGEVLYSVNYNIKEKSGSPSADGQLDAADALRMFPQGHGDAYGHYLTALTGYYKLLQHPSYTWTPQAEAVTVLGQAVLIDYKDERKFAANANNLSRAAQQILTLIHRQSYQDDPAAGWQHFRDGKHNTQTGVTRHQGLDESSSRFAQGNFFHWVTGNALLPDRDTNPDHSGVQIIDRTTVPELNELVSASESFQANMDLANAHLNPLGLSPRAIAFDISPAEHQAGNSHFEQIYQRALRTLLNAKGSFDQAAKMTRLLRNQENQIANQQDAIVAQEEAYVNQLVDLYGKPYAGDIGPGKTYAQGYDGPDLARWYIINRPTDLVDTTKTVTVNLRVPTQIVGFAGGTLDNIKTNYEATGTVLKSFAIAPNQFAQFAQVIDPTLGSRPETGTLQQALIDSYLARVALLEAHQDAETMRFRLQRDYEVLSGLFASHQKILETQVLSNIQVTSLQLSSNVLGAVAKSLTLADLRVKELIAANIEGLPKASGLAPDLSFWARAYAKFTGFVSTHSLGIGALVAGTGALALDAAADGVERDLQPALQRIGFDQDKLQAAAEFQMSYAELVSQHFRLAKLMTHYQTANQRVANLAAQGDRLLLERETFRQRAAAVITGFRTKDLTFRTFRNEALEQYRTLFDLASRYTFLAAKSYDYETGLLGSPEGQAVINRIVASRSLGDLTGGVPQATTSTLGDAGLAGTMAQLNADFSVAEGRLGINNPDPQGTLFSLRYELYRILDETTNDDDAWQQALEQQILPDLLADPDVAKHCNNLRKPDGSAVPGILIPFSTTIQHGQNFFGLPSASGDHNYSPSSFATKIDSTGIVVSGYVGMDPYAAGTPNAGSPNSSAPNALNATPYFYLIPTGTDYMLAPPLGDTNTLRSWTVHDQALPLPYNLGASAFNTTQFFSANGTLSEKPWIIRKHQAFRPVNDPVFFYGLVPAEFTNARLIGRSVWNSQWKIVIPAYTLLNDEQEGLNRFVASVTDIKLFLRTYSHSGN